MYELDLITYRVNKLVMEGETSEWVSDSFHLFSKISIVRSEPFYNRELEMVNSTRR